MFLSITNRLESYLLVEFWGYGTQYVWKDVAFHNSVIKRKIWETGGLPYYVYLVCGGVMHNDTGIHKGGNIRDLGAVYVDFHQGLTLGQIAYIGHFCVVIHVNVGQIGQACQVIQGTEEIVFAANDL